MKYSNEHPELTDVPKYQHSILGFVVLSVHVLYNGNRPRYYRPAPAVILYSLTGQMFSHCGSKLAHSPELDTHAPHGHLDQLQNILASNVFNNCRLSLHSKYYYWKMGLGTLHYLLCEVSNNDFSACQ